jgi:broad specificity phosphatase PhoE
MTRATLLRHAESASNAHTGTETLSEEAGDRLTERGLQQARAAGEGLAGRGFTRLMTSPMRRAAETADLVGAALGIEPAVVPHAHELGAGESFEQLVARIRRLKADLEALDAGERPLVVTHGIFIRFFLLDAVLADGFEPPMAGRIWHLRSHNCGVSEFEPEGARDPSGGETPGWTCVSWMARPWDPP